MMNFRGTGRGSAGYEISVCDAQRTECNPELSWWQSGRSKALCFSVSVQRVCQAIIQAGIKTIVYDCDKYEHTPSVIASKRMLDAAGVRYYKYNRSGKAITLSV